MAKAPTGFVPLDMNYLRDPAIRKAGPDAELLYVRSLAHCKAGQTDGKVWEYDLPVVAVGLKNTAARVTALVRENLWVKCDGYWLIRSWAKWNMTQQEIAEDKSKKRDAAIKTNHDRWHGDRTDPNCPHCIESLLRSVER
jgi:hypothetical protein